VLIAQVHPATWFDRVGDGDGGPIGDIHVELTGVRREGDRLQATVRYSSGADQWAQEFIARRLDETALRRELHAVGLAFDRWLDVGRSWFAARPSRDSD
jgi:hypothetical protein